MSKNAGVARTRRSESEWRALIEEQAGSGLSQRKFCVSHGVSLSSFTNARRRFAAPASRPAAPEFVPVTMDTGEGTGWELELALGGGVTLRLRQR